MYSYGLDFSDMTARVEAATVFDCAGSARVTAGKNILQMQMAIEKGRLPSFDGMYPKTYGSTRKLVGLKAHAYLEYIYVKVDGVQYPKCRREEVENCLEQWDRRKAAAATHRHVIKDSVKCQPKATC